MTGLLGEEQVAAATLVCLPEMTPRRLQSLLCRFGSAIAAVAAVRAGLGAAACDDARLGPVAAGWTRAVDERATPALLAQRRTRVFVAGSDGYPIAEGVPDRPAVLLAEGEAPDVLERPRVGIVGTRAASVHGLRDARDLGAFLGRCGVTVVSGLAIGIDGAAHEGAMASGGGAVGVVATGLDVVYPRRHVTLFEGVRRAGLLVSESAFGTRPQRSRFPVRNRIIAALSDALVVVEATASGGARITAGFALEYGRTVLAVPGSRRNPAAAGCNALLADGAHPLLDPSDVLVALGMSPGSRRGWGAPAAAPGPLTGDAAALLHACAGEPATPDQLASRTTLGADRVARALRDLQRARRVEVAEGLVWPR